MRRVPKGRVISYGEIAKILGCPRAARQVGWAMRQSPNDIPWQRVVKADGAVAGGEYAQLRRALLEAEGVGFLPDGRVIWKNTAYNKTQHITKPPHGLCLCGGFFSVAVMPFFYFSRL